MGTEAAFQNQVVKAARLHGLAVYHTYDSRRSEAGFPDLTIVGSNGIMFRELKSERGKASPYQEYWLAALNEAGVDARVWRPSDWPAIIRELKALGRLTAERPPPTQAQIRALLQRDR